MVNFQSNYYTQDLVVQQRAIELQESTFKTIIYLQVPKQFESFFTPPTSVHSMQFYSLLLSPLISRFPLYDSPLDMFSIYSWLSIFLFLACKLKLKLIKLNRKLLLLLPSSVLCHLQLLLLTTPFSFICTIRLSQPSLSLHSNHSSLTSELISRYSDSNCSPPSWNWTCFWSSERNPLWEFHSHWR